MTPAPYQVPLTPESAVKEIEDDTRVHCEVKANKQQVRQAVKKLCDVDVAKVNT